MTETSKKSITRSFVASTIYTTASAAVTLFTTVLIIRILGAQVYASQILDLAIISIITLLMEALPSSYIVFKIQDDPSWKPILITQLAITAAATCIFVYFTSLLLPIFHTSSPWLTIYVLSMFVKRYNDILMQSSGRVHLLFLLDLVGSLSRLALIFFLYGRYSASTTVWSSLAISNIIAYSAGAIYLQCKYGECKMISVAKQVAIINSNRKEMIEYYPNIVLKRVSDASITLMAGVYFQSSSILATFLLAYRGVSFSNVFSRIFESILNNKLFLDYIDRQRAFFVPALALSSQVVAALSAYALLKLSGMKVSEYWTLAILSAVCWPMAYMSALRAIHYSKYNARRISIAYIYYLIVLALSASITYALGLNSMISYSVCILISYTALAQKLK